MIELEIKYKYFKEWMENGGKDNLPSSLDNSLKKLKFDKNGKLIFDSVDSSLNTAMLAIVANHLGKPFFDGKNLGEYRSTLQKDNYFEQYVIETIEEFDSFYDEYSVAGKTIFRGVREAKWRLYNSMQRFWIETEKNNNDDEYKTFIKSLLDNARKENDYLLSKFLKKNNINPDNDVAVLSFLQHYKCATPMLDWTYNLDCALFFATEKISIPGKLDIDNYISIYFLEEEHIKDSSLRGIAEKVIKSYEEKIRLETIENAKKENITEEEISKFFSPYRLELTAKLMYGKLAITGACKIDSIFLYPIAYFSDVDEDVQDLIPFSLNNNLNVVNQNGVFIFNKHPIEPLEEIGKIFYEESGNAADYRFCKCYNINKSLISHIVEKITSNNVTKETIYPDPIKLVNNAFQNTLKNLS